MKPLAPSNVELLVLRCGLAFIWLATGCAVVTDEYQRLGRAYLEPTGLPSWVMFAACAGEVLLGLWVLSGLAGTAAALTQAVLIVGFTIILSVTQPALWGHPFGVLGKNLPLLALVGVAYLLQTEGWTPRTTWLLRIGMATVWLTEGLFACLLFQSDEIRRVADSTGLAYPDATTFLNIAGVVQILSAAAALLLRGRPLQVLLAAQTLGLAGVTIVVSRYQPSLWLHPFGPLTKNVPLLLGTAVLLAHVVQRFSYSNDSSA